MQTHWDTLWKSHKSYDIHPQLLETIKKYSKGKRVLEIGFGTGGDLLELKKKGFDCYGIETSKIATKRGKKSLGEKKIFFGNGENMDFPKDFFDAIFHQGVLEHFPDPTKFLLEHRRVLSQKGVIIIDVPHKWNVYTLYRKGLQMRGKWYGGWERSYSQSELTKLLDKCGFQSVAIQYRGIFPHQWGKILFPENIKEKAWVASVLRKPGIRQIQLSLRYFYDKSKLMQVLSSYNIIIIAKKKPDTLLATN